MDPANIISSPKDAANFCNINKMNITKGKRNGKANNKPRTKDRKNNNNHGKNVQRKAKNGAAGIGGGGGAEEAKHRRLIDSAPTPPLKDVVVVVESFDEALQRAGGSRTPSPNLHWLDPQTRTYKPATAVADSPQFQPKILLKPCVKPETAEMRKSLPAAAESGYRETE